jgi:hypothetical protein
MVKQLVFQLAQPKANFDCGLDLFQVPGRKDSNAIVLESAMVESFDLKALEYGRVRQAILSSWFNFDFVSIDAFALKGASRNNGNYERFEIDVIDRQNDDGPALVIQLTTARRPKLHERHFATIDGHDDTLFGVTPNR